MSVLLLEAGGKDRSLNIKIPAAFPNQFHTKLDWDYRTEPEPHCDGRSLYIPRGKTLGGSSSMNAMLYVRGRPLDYDLWEAAGATGWGWDGVLPYFLKAENNERGASEFHARRGSAERGRAALAAPARREVPRRRGGGRHPADRRLQRARAGRRRRCSRSPSAAAGAGAPPTRYLRPALGRPNLRVVTGAHALGLEWDGGRVAGVRYARRGAPGARWRAPSAR